MGRPLKSFSQNRSPFDSKASSLNSTFNSNSFNSNGILSQQQPVLEEHPKQYINLNKVKNSRKPRKLQIEAPSRLDCAKGIAEQIIQRQGNQPTDRYMIITCDENEKVSIKCNLKDTQETAIAEIKALKSGDKFNGGMALSALFQQVRLLRTTYDIDTYGQGRYPCLHEVTHIFWITDGASMLSENDVISKLNIPVNSNTWSDMYQEPFRWDQKLFTVFLHEFGDKELCVKGTNSCEGLLAPMSTVMGGSSGIHHISSMKDAQKFVDMLCPARRPAFSKITMSSGLIATGGVVVNFERLNNDLNSSPVFDQKVLLMAPEPAALTNSFSNNKILSSGFGVGSAMVSNGSAGYFPIPESFWQAAVAEKALRNSEITDSTLSGSLQPNTPPRPAHATLLYGESPIPWTVPSKFPFDKFQVDTNSKVSQNLLVATEAAYKTNPDPQPLCWPVYVANSYRANNAGFPFGLLRANTARNAINLFILPYNFPALFILLRRYESAVKSGFLKNWKTELDEYLTHTPFYYSTPLKRAFALYGMQKGLISETYGNSISVNTLKRFVADQRSLAKRQWEAMQPASIALPTHAQKVENFFETGDEDISASSALISNSFDIPRDKMLNSLNTMRKQMVHSFLDMSKSLGNKELVIPKVFFSFIDPTGDNQGLYSEMSNSEENYTNSYSDSIIKGTKRKLVLQADKQDGIKPDNKHTLPIAVMGQYQQTMTRKQAQEPRDPMIEDETLKFIKKTMFGNPYRKQPKSGPGYPQNSPQPHHLLVTQQQQQQQQQPQKSIPQPVAQSSFLQKTAKPGTTLTDQDIHSAQPADSDSKLEPQLQLQPQPGTSIGSANTGSVEIAELETTSAKQGSTSDSAQLPIEAIANNEVDGEAQLNNVTSIEDSINFTALQAPDTSVGYQYTRFGWIQKHKGATRYRSLVGSWKPGDYSWNVNPWNKNSTTSNQDKSNDSSKRVPNSCNAEKVDTSTTDSKNKSQAENSQNIITSHLEPQNHAGITIEQHVELVQLETSAKQLIEINDHTVSTGTSTSTSTTNDDPSNCEDVKSNNDNLTENKSANSQDISLTDSTKTTEDLPLSITTEQTRLESNENIEVPAALLSELTGHSDNQEQDLVPQKEERSIVKAEETQPIAYSLRASTQSASTNANTSADASTSKTRKKAATTKSKKTPAQLKAYLVKQIKLDSKKYNEATIFESTEFLHPDSPNYTKDQKKSIINACLTAAKPLRKRNLVSHLELLLKSIGN